MNPEAHVNPRPRALQDLEMQIRAALLQDAGPELPKILEVTELQTYYHMEDPSI